ncbi:uncharacterized protein MEPE_00252 [Melanopsichium pennsylvanicum]|uniref:Uncharacterized protein n=1 Tax=Melanopsichium pennsylvanicum TaxID=63383 RepID=A0AAJ4XFS9_9BASI|nr:uncharacterized protein MEPE_00252 [Melanopsichium pennsylvanicum]
MYCIELIKYGQTEVEWAQAWRNQSQAFSDMITGRVKIDSGSSDRARCRNDAVNGQKMNSQAELSSETLESRPGWHAFENLYSTFPLIIDLIGEYGPKTLGAKKPRQSVCLLANGRTNQTPLMTFKLEHSSPH